MIDNNNSNIVCSLKYKLERSDILSCLKNTGYYKISMKKNIVESIILLAALIIFAISFVVYKTKTNFIMSVICLLALVAIWALPEVMARKQISKGKRHSTDIIFDVFDDHITIKRGNAFWNINKYDIKLKVYKDMFIFYLPDTKIIPLPFRAVESDKLEKIKNMLKQ